MYKYENYKERLFEEYKDLSSRIKKLRVFIESSNFSEIDSRQQELLKDQLEVMDRYLNILSIRLELLNN